MLLTMLGEYVLPGQGQVWQETLVQALGALGYKRGAARQALSRSVAAGWLDAERHGRRSRVSLTQEARGMLSAGAARIYSFGRPWDWDGRWLLVMMRVPELRRDVRHQVRTQLAWAGFGTLGAGDLISPHVEREAEVEAIAAANPSAGLQTFVATFGKLGDPEDVIAKAWDLDGVADTYRAFIASFRRLTPNGPEAVFQAQTRLVHAWRKFPFLDPDLPESMLPARWPRSEAHKLFTDKHATWSASATGYFEACDSGRAERGDQATAA
jgi:phenylacetic acid degradation operon negative regulatory protein